ncbi:MAG TPA: GntP family permease [Bacteroidales bacterium]|jgi:GntP family gluconate:H+ symporter|nr:GntP family permease [Bacteroidales bacterium]HQB35915.1 GntP family permease [Bacteroidales bacterium]
MLLIVVLILCIVFIVISSTKLKLHAFLALLFAALAFGIFTGMPLNKIVESINTGFGNTIGYIGIVIVAGTIIGVFLEYSGGAYTLADRILKVIGEKNVPLAMSIIGWFVSIPVFADSGFVILSPLNKALAKRAKISLAGPAIALSLGLISTHCLVPPTPGPIAAAGIIGANLGLVILFGLAASLFALFFAWLFSIKVAAKVPIDPNPELTEEAIALKMKDSPSTIMTITPILLPIILIVLKSISDFPTNPLGEGVFKSFFSFIGEPVIALLIGVLIAFMIPKNKEKGMYSETGWIGKAMISAATIILITGAGGAFGRVLQNSDLADTIGSTLSGLNLGIWLPFIIAVVLKTAQGSSTVALITTSSLILPFLPSLGFTSDIAKVLVVLIIGSGSMIVSHANDSFFWVVTQMSNMDVKTGYKLQSGGTLVLGISAAIFIWIMSLIFI